MTKRPNILFIMADDHAAAAISAYGSGLNHTPNIDRLAQEGMRLDGCYVTNSICTPSRAAILTGTYNHVNLVTTLDTHIDNRLPHVAKHLRAAGYRTGMFGKWHLGEGRAHEPTGFDEWSVLPGQGDYFDPVMIRPCGRNRSPWLCDRYHHGSVHRFPAARRCRTALFSDVSSQGTPSPLRSASTLLRSLCR